MGISTNDEEAVVAGLRKSKRLLIMDGKNCISASCNSYNFGIALFNMNCLLWNIRGIGKGERSIVIRKLVNQQKVTFMGLVETKHKNSMRSRMKRM